MSPVSSSRKNVGFETECVKFFAEVVQVFGMPNSIGQIYGLLYASLTPLSFSDIIERLDISKGSASQGLQLLRYLGAIKLASGPKAELSAEEFGAPWSLRRSVVPTARREYYEPELSLRMLVSGVLRERIAPLAVTGEARLARLRELAEQEGEGNSLFLARVKQLGTWRRRLRAVLPVLTALLGPKIRR